MRKVYLLGHPVAHSVSPQMHNAAYRMLGLDMEYGLIDVEQQDLEGTVARLKKEGAAGFNVTVPHKEAVMAYLDVIDATAALIGAVNTVRNEGGKLIGFNTDWTGFFDDIRARYGKKDLKSKKTVLLGAGGAAKAVAFALKELGAESSVYDTDNKKAKDLSSAYPGMALISGSEELYKAVAECEILVNTTPVGMHPNIASSPVPADLLNSKMFVYDLVYNPPVTKLLGDANAKGARGCNGLGMLVMQGAAAFKLFTGKEAPLDVMFAAAGKLLDLPHGPGNDKLPQRQ